MQPKLATYPEFSTKDVIGYFNSNTHLCEKNDPQEKRLESVKLFLKEQFNLSMVRAMKSEYKKLRKQHREHNCVFVSIKQNSNVQQELKNLFQSCNSKI